MSLADLCISDLFTFFVLLCLELAVSTLLFDHTKFKLPSEFSAEAPSCVLSLSFSLPPSFLPLFPSSSCAVPFQSMLRASCSWGHQVISLQKKSYLLFFFLIFNRSFLYFCIWRFSVLTVFNTVSHT